MSYYRGVRANYVRLARRNRLGEEAARDLRRGSMLSTEMLEVWLSAEAMRAVWQWAFLASAVFNVWMVWA